MSLIKSFISVNLAQEQKINYQLHFLFEVIYNWYCLRTGFWLGYQWYCPITDFWLRLYILVILPLQLISYCFSGLYISDIALKQISDCFLIWASDLGFILMILAWNRFLIEVLWEYNRILVILYFNVSLLNIKPPWYIYIIVFFKTNTSTFSFTVKFIYPWFCLPAIVYLYGVFHQNWNILTDQLIWWKMIVAKCS